MTPPRHTSLNYKEIDLLLAELNLSGARVQEIFQPRPEMLILGLYLGGHLRRLCFVMSQRACRFHLYKGPVAREKIKQRFVSFLTARVLEAALEGIDHVCHQRILKLIFRRGGSRVFLWVRLWSSAPNIIFTDEAGRIGDALFRRPKKNEISGGHYHPEEAWLRTPFIPDADDRFTVRDFGGDPHATVHERVEAYFRDSDDRGKEAGLRERLLHAAAVEERRLEKALRAADAWLAEHTDGERLRQYGDILMGDLGSIDPTSGWYRGRDFFNGDAPIEIALEKSLSPAQNAEHYYRLYKKTKGTAEHTQRERAETLKRLEAVRRRIKEVEIMEDVVRLQDVARKIVRTKIEAPPGGLPGLTFISGGFVILVGRTAKENESLFRRHVRGNDFWMHIRDFPGASVFIKNRKEKSVPLDVLLDAANLALFYSKAKSSGKADLYYTRVKYLKKAKGGKIGLFLPTQEKNMSVRLDAERIGRLKRAPENDV